MNLTVMVPVSMIATLFAATPTARLFDGAPGNGIPTSDEQSNLRVRKDPDAIRDLKDVLFDFDTP